MSDNAIPSRAKICGTYANSALAAADAGRAGYQDAVLLTEGGTVADSAFNLFLLRKGCLVPPVVTEDIHTAPGGADRVFFIGATEAPRTLLGAFVSCW